MEKEVDAAGVGGKKGSPAKSVTSSVSSSRTQTDDESITTSTESEAFEETWTLVTDKNNPSDQGEAKVAQQSSEANRNADERVEVLKKNKMKTSQEINAEMKAKIEETQEGDHGDDDGAEDNDNDDGNGDGDGDGDEEEEEDDDEAEEAEEAIDTDKDNYGRKSDHDNTADDELSDGISIISESESAGRISPNHSAERLNLKIAMGETINEEIPRSKLNFPIKLSAPINQNGQDENDNAKSQVLLRRRRRSGSHSSTTDKNKKAVKPVNTLARFTNIPEFIKKSFNALFYIGVIIAVLAFLGRVRMMYYQPEGAEHLEQKLHDIQMQNNLMRAEIDLLNKQVKHLKNLQDPNAKYADKGAHKAHPYFIPKDRKLKGKESFFQAWAGHDDSLEPVFISKKDLKKPYQCPDGRFVEVAHMCIERKDMKEDNIIDPGTVVVDELLDKTGQFKEFAKFAENINRFVENPFDIITDNVLKRSDQTEEEEATTTTTTTGKTTEEIPVFKAMHQRPEHFDLPPKQWPQEKYLNDDEKDHEQRIPLRAPYKPPHKTNYDQRQSAPENRKTDFNSKERFNENRKANFNSKERLNENRKVDFNSKERFNENRKADFNSKERFNENRKVDFNSKERLNEKRKQFANKENFKRNDSKERFGRNKSKEDYRKDNSRERFNKNSSKENFRKMNSKEHFDRKAPRYPSNNSKERYDSKENRRPKYNSDENRKKDSDWHEQLMQHREQARHQRNEINHDPKNSKNWYIERGDNREQLRFQ